MAAKQNNVTSFELAKRTREIREAMLELGYIKIANALQDALCQVELSGRQHRVVNAVIRKTIGYQKDFDWLVAEQIAEVMGYSGDLANIRSDIRKLKARKVLIQNGKQRIGINMDVVEWMGKDEQVKNNLLTGRKQPANRLKTTHKRVESDPTKEKDNIKDNILKEMSDKDQTSPVDQPSESEPVQVQSKPSRPRQKSTTVSEDVNKIFEHWKTRMNHPRAKLDDTRKRLISKALKMEYSVDDLTTAIDGCAKTPFNMGQNPQGRVYDSLDLIFRNADKIETFIHNASLVMNSQQPQQNHNHNDLDDISWMTGYQNNNNDGDLF